DYFNTDYNENCWYNPDVFSTPENISHNHGFEFQTHFVMTDDGYFLTIFRVQDKFSSFKKQPILLHHGIISSAVGFMTSGDRSLAFYLARNGYDMWLANHRGNTYSLGHSHLKTSDPKYWNFSFHEIGLYDLPATMEYITKKTGNFRKIIYVGHSMGCTVCFIYTSLKKDHAEKYLKGFIALSPATAMKYFRSDFRPLLPILNKLIEDVMVTLSYHPARTSLKCIAHFLQLMMVGKFQHYDYGWKENLNKYNSVVPPEYPLSDITIPVHMFYGLNDNLVSYQDVLWVFNELTTPEKSIDVVPKNRKIKFNHVNFLLSKHIEFYLYKPLMKIIKALEIRNTSK
ncbi:gastric triacylglycerol lipase, partial [Asbolus verrucosus]